MRPRHHVVAGVGALVVALSGCGGGGGGTTDTPATADPGSVQTMAITSRATGTTYPLSVYLPPASAGERRNLPVIYSLDGETWFQTLRAAAESTGTAAIIVGIGTAGQRNVDYVPVNTCTTGGGGHQRYFDFLRQELLPFIESTVGAGTTRRILFGHSHGGSLVLYGLFSEGPAQHTFGSYLASDSSISCLPDAARGWESAYAATYRSLPVRLHFSYASLGNYSANLDYAGLVASRSYADLVLANRLFYGSHTGIVPDVLRDGIPFVLGTGP